jgi:hypothetical protein
VLGQHGDEATMEVCMFKLNVPLWELLLYGAGLSLIVLLRIKGELLKDRLGRPRISVGSVATR